MDATLAYALSLSTFLTIAGWYMLRGKKIHRLEVQLPLATVFIAIGVLSLKYIDVLPESYVPLFKYYTIIMCLLGGMAMLMTGQASHPKTK